MAVFSRSRVISMFAGGICGIAPKPGSVLAGVYMILMTNMYLIFEFGHLNLALAALAQIDPKGSLWIILHCYYTAIIMAFVTYPICFYYIYCIYKRDTIGMFIYFFWIIFYDISNFVILLLTYKAAEVTTFSVSPLEWFGLAARIPVDCFWLSFVITHALLLIEGRSIGRMSMRSRRASRHTTEPPKFRLGTNISRIQL